MLKVVCISDTHNSLAKVNLPDGDLLIHSGDATGMGTVEEILKFNTQLSKIKTKYKHGIIFTPGNHDWLFETDEGLARKIMRNATVLINESITIDGRLIYGSPYQPEFCDWAFNLQRNGKKLKAVWDMIPDDVEILITHGPPKWVLDEVFIGESFGCELLAERVEELSKLKLHVFGHIHYSYGHRVKWGRVDFVNASSLNERYQYTNDPIVIDLD